ncbi:MAG TPA: NADH-quinone oxidoreductase subunit L [Bryobacteraceae bacterium]|nr:NADH-quinone oxidoreductase subunit L [Bryobacteraceae bacterium]
MQLWLIPIFPLAGFVINGLFGRRFSKALINTVAIASVILSFAWALKAILTADLSAVHSEHYFTWIQSGAFRVDCDFALDRLTAVMLLVVTGIGSLIHIYSIGYMAHEGGYYRFFAYLNLFMFFMLTLVLAANYLVLFVGWEGVGLCSYLLIGFYFDKQFATNAGNKAFIVNRIGDFGFSLAVFYIVKHFGSLDFGTVFRQAPGASEAVLTTIGLLLMVGACGKSAQIPLYVWLPDAMAGPTPVSALIHAATMVTAGVYMTARSWPIYIHAPGALEVIAIIGIATAFFAATIGLAQNDIKKVFAYSTVSQLGYMFVGVGCGAFSAGIYHLMTHAFFKALLFLGAGSVIHAMAGEQDMRRMGGLRKKIPWTHWTMLCASLAIAGVPLTSGFFSKDAILLGAAHLHMWIYWVGVFTAGMTAFYVFRAFFLTFYGPYRGDAHPHESPPVMTIPLAILAVLSLGGGFIDIPKFFLPYFYGGNPPEVPENMGLMLFASSAGILGIFLAWLMYVYRPKLADSFAGGVKGLYTLVYNKYFVDEIYDATIVKPVVGGSRVVLWKGADAGLIDGIVNGIGTAARTVGAGLRQMQSGNIRSYATWVLAGGVAVIVALGVLLGTAGGVR